MRIYVASSWSYEYQPRVVGELRKLGHKVYDFRSKETGFHWSDIDPNWKDWTSKQYREALNHPLAVKGFISDVTALESAQATILVLPCGRSAHLEFGYAVAAHQTTIVFFPDEVQDIEPELMVKMAYKIIVGWDELKGWFYGVPEEDKGDKS